jgi:hypothetical protein
MMTMNSDKYRDLIRAIQKPVGPANSERRCLQEKFSLLSQMVFLMATNDLEMIEKRQEKLEVKLSKYAKYGVVFGFAILLGILFQSPETLKTVFGLLVKIF